MHPFRAAIEARDMDAAVELLSPDVVFRTPVAFKPYQGRGAVAPILRAVSLVFEASIDELVVMVRPLTATLALTDAMTAQRTSAAPSGST